MYVLNTGMSLTALALACILMASSISFGEVFATNDDSKYDDKKEKHEDKKEKLEEVKEKIKDKIEEIKEKIDDKKKEKLEKIKNKIIKKIKDKIADYKEKKSKKSSSDEQDDSNEVETPENSHEDETNNESSNNTDETNNESSLNEEETTNNESTVIHENTQKTMNKFKGSGDDYAPTLGSDRYGNNYVENGFTFNNFVTDVDGFKTHMPLQTLQVGEKNTVTLKIFENRGANKIEHVELAFGLDYDEHASQSKNKIIWKQNFKGDQSIIENDPDNLLMDVNAVGKLNEKILEITFDFAFRAPMDKSQIGVVVWDQEKHSRTVYFNDGIEVVGESLNPPEVITILDEKGYPVKITMTGKNEGIDEFGNIWTHNSPWKKQSISLENTEKTFESVGSHGFDRSHEMFESYKNTQAQSAQEKLKEILGGNDIYNFSD